MVDESIQNSAIDSSNAQNIENRVEQQPVKEAEQPKVEEKPKEEPKIEEKKEQPNVEEPELEKPVAVDAPTHPDTHLEKERHFVRHRHKHQTFKILAITVAAILVVSVLTQVIGPQYTGFVIKQTDAINVKEMAYKESRHFVTAKDNDTIPMKSAKISGTILGNGTVKVYLSSPEGLKLIFSNIKEAFKPTLITGFAVYETMYEIDATSMLTANLDELKIVGDNNNILEGIDLVAVGNDLGMNIEQLKISWNPDNAEKVQEIMLNNEKFWNYKDAGSPSGKQRSGTLLKGWSQKLPNEQERPLEPIVFDSDMTDKEVKLEVYFNDYLAGFRLGEERLVEIFIDLSGEKESYVEEKGKGRIQKFRIELADRGKQPTKPQDSSQDAEKDSIGTGDSASGQGDASIIADIDGTTTADKDIPSSGNQPYIPSLVRSLPPKERYKSFLTEGKTVKTVDLPREEVVFVEKNLSVEVNVIEDQKYKEIFEKTPIKEDDVQQIISECDETCIIDPLEEGEYQFVFEIDEGTALNVTNIEFS
jgi:hypothetical protein